METVDTFVRIKAMGKVTSASPYGGNLSEWPSRLVDSMIAIQDELSKIEELFHK